MIRVPVTNEEEAAAALDAMGATPEKKAAFLEALPGLKENAEKMGGGNGYHYERCELRDPRRREFLPRLKQAAEDMEALARQAVFYGDMDAAAVLLKDAANVRDVIANKMKKQPAETPRD